MTVNHVITQIAVIKHVENIKLAKIILREKIVFRFIKIVKLESIDSTK